MGDLNIPDGLDPPEKRALLISHLLTEHEFERDDFGGAFGSLDALTVLHETCDLSEDEDGSGDTTIEVCEDGEQVSLVVTDVDGEYTYTVPPQEAFRIGSDLIKAAGLALSQVKITNILFER